MFRTFSLLAAFALVLTACDSNNPDDATARIEANVVTELAADPGARDPNTGQVSDTGQFTLYSLRDGEAVLSYDDEDRSDSTSTLWDIGLRGTDIIINGGTSGPGAGGALVLEEAFDDVMEVPASAQFRVDGVDECPTVQTPFGTRPGDPLAVCDGTGNGWYTYVPFPGGRGGYILPTPGRTLLVRTADGEGYAKVRFENYYQGRPAAADITDTSVDRYYTFEYVVNPDGTSFETAAE